MTNPLKPWGVAPEQSQVRDRLETLERSTGPAVTPVYFELVLEFNDGLYSNQETLRYPVGRAFSVTGYRFAGDTAGSTSTSIQIRKTGATAATITIAASTQLLTSTPLAIGYARGDWVQGNVSSAGTGAAGFTVVLECQEQ